MINYKLNKDNVNGQTNGTHKVGTLENVTYRELVELLGQPTYYPEDSGDGKIQFEWVIRYNDEIFTVYDWKTYDENYTRNELTTWSIGGKFNAIHLKLDIYKALNKLNTIEV